MKNSVYIILLLALGLTFTSYKWVTSSGVSDKSEEVKSDINSGASASASSALENIMTRTSVRSYTDRPVSEGMVDTLLRAAMAAPTAGNKQPWRFVVVRDRKTLDFIADHFDSMTMMKKAQVAFIVCGEPAATFPGEGAEYWVQDASAATENLLLAAHAEGLGAVWCGVYPIQERVRTFSELLHLPSGIIPLNCIAVGYPDGKTTPKDKWVPDYVHYEKF